MKNERNHATSKDKMDKRISVRVLLLLKIDKERHRDSKLDENITSSNYTNQDCTCVVPVNSIIPQFLSTASWKGCRNKFMIYSLYKDETKCKQTFKGCSTGTEFYLRLYHITIAFETSGYFAHYQTSHKMANTDEKNHD